DPRLPANQVFSTALGGGMSSRLFQEVREVRGLAYAIHAQASAYADTGLLTIYAGTGGGDVGELCAITLDEIRRAAEDMSGAEVDRARAQLRAGLLMGLESPSARAERAARLLSLKGRVPPVAEAIAELEAVDTAAVRAEAARLITAAAPAAVLYGPVADAPDHGALAARLAA
ncbi:MAG: insulinase family protein, partial [Pseudomonadota bacterium]